MSTNYKKLRFVKTDLITQSMNFYGATVTIPRTSADGSLNSIYATKFPECKFPQTAKERKRKVLATNKHDQTCVADRSNITGTIADTQRPDVPSVVTNRSHIAQPSKESYKSKDQTFTNCDQYVSTARYVVEDIVTLKTCEK